MRGPISDYVYVMMSSQEDVMSATSGKRGPKSKRASEQYAFSDKDGIEWLFSLVVGASLTGGAIRVGLSRDGGALALGVYKGEEYGTEYVRPNEDLGMAVREIILAWDIPYARWDDEANQWVLVP
jgi:hypothetical protein